jgi:DNA-binding MarR family transcriptional regulator
MERNPEKYIGYWINKVERTMKNIHDQKFQKYDLTLSQAAVLHQLWHKDGLTQKEIQENLSLRGASVSGLVDTLLKKGLIARRQDQEDARYKRLYFSDEGRRLEEQTMKIILEVEDFISTGFSEDEKVIAVCWLKKLYNNLSLMDK